MGGNSKRLLVLGCRRFNFIRPVRVEPLRPMTTPDLRMWMNATQKHQLSCGTPADQNYPRSVPHDFGNQFGNFLIRKRAGAVRGKWGECSIIIQQQRSRLGPGDALHEASADILMNSYSHFRLWRNFLRGWLTVLACLIQRAQRLLFVS